MSSLLFEISRGGLVRLVDPERDGAGRECGAIVIALCITIPLNALIITSILGSFLRAHVFNVLLCAMCMTAFLDAAVNLTLASVFRASWTDLYFWVGDSLRWMCRINAASTQLPMIIQVFCLVLLSAHRLTSLTPGNQLSSPKKSPEMKRYGWLLLLSSIAAFSIVLPVALGTVDVKYFQERYSCSPVNVTKNTASFATALTLMTFGHCLPYILMAVIWTLLILRILRERQRLLNLEIVALQRAVARSSPVRGMSSSLNFSFPTWNLFWGEGDTAAGQGSRFFILIGLLISLQFLLVLPGLIYIIVNQFILPLQPYHHNHHLYNFGDQLPIPLDYLPIHTPWFDDTFTWMRILHNIIVPFIILAFHQNLRTQTFDMLGICNQNKYSQLTPVPTISGFITKRKSKRKKSKYSHLTDENTPILFVTSNGLHLRHNVDKNLPYFITNLSDLSLKQGGENVKKLSVSPSALKKMKIKEVQDLEEDDLVIKKVKNGKSVRFSQNVNEIPENNVTETNRIQVGPRSEPKIEKRTEINKMKEFVGRTERRSSDPMTIKRNYRTLEMELIDDSSFGSSLSGSLLLPLSQRMRPRDL